MIPGVILTGGLDGMLRTYASDDGSALWSFDTTKKIDGEWRGGRGGSIGSGSPWLCTMRSLSHLAT